MIRLFFVVALAVAAGSSQAAGAGYPLAPPGQGENGDWANLAFYRDANATVSKENRPQVVFMGDSITQAWAGKPPFQQHSNWLGRGIGGQVTQQMLVRFRADVVSLQPAVVHIMAGTNDLAGNIGPLSDTDIEDGIVSMIELARFHNIRVVLAGIPPALDFKWHPGLEPAPRIRRINAWLESYAAQNKIVYVDYAKALATASGGIKPEYSSDGVHPNVEGYVAMTVLTEAAIAAAMKGPAPQASP